MPSKSRKNNAWTWPLVALIGLLLVVLGGTILALSVRYY